MFYHETQKQLNNNTNSDDDYNNNSHNNPKICQYCGVIVVEFCHVEPMLKDNIYCCYMLVCVLKDFWSLDSTKPSLSLQIIIILIQN